MNRSKKENEYRNWMRGVAAHAGSPILSHRTGRFNWVAGLTMDYIFRNCGVPAIKRQLGQYDRMLKMMKERANRIGHIDREKQRGNAGKGKS